MVTAATLNRLVRLSDVDPDAAHEQLEHLAEARPDRLAQLLSLEPSELAVRGRALVQQARSARARHASKRRVARAAQMARAVAALESSALIRSDEILLDPPTFSAVTSIRAKGSLLFDSPLAHGGVDLRLLGRLVRECRSAELSTVRLHAQQLHIRYRTSSGRGHFRLELNQPDVGTSVFPVNLHPKPAPTSQQLGGVWSYLFDAVGAAA